MSLVVSCFAFAVSIVSILLMVFLGLSVERAFLIVILSNVCFILGKVATGDPR